MEKNSFTENNEIPTNFYSFLDAVEIKRQTADIETERQKILIFLRSLSLDLKEFPDEKMIKAIFEANSCNK